MDMKSPLPKEWSTPVNIFADFSSDKKLNDEVTKMEEKKKKTPLYYVSVATNIFKSLNIILFLWIVLFYAYYYAQKSSSIDLSLLDPICGVFVWDVPALDSGCTWVTSFLDRLKFQTEDLKTQEYSKISSIIGDIYASENFIYSKEITFLINKSKLRAKPLEILKEFDRLKNQFEPFEKSKVSCYDLTFGDWNNFKVTCDAFSSDWDSKIVGFSWDKSRSTVQGTSISVANSFINFMQENSKAFTVINKQKVFWTFQVNENGPYTKKTKFTLEMIYNTDNL